LEQTSSLLSLENPDNLSVASPNSYRSHQIADRAKFLSALERFKDYSIYLSNDGLIKLMTSFVALSMNNIAIFSTVLVGEVRSNPSEKSSQKVEDKDAALVLYSIKAVIDISKKNSFRIATIWQMVISHLRMITASKVSNSSVALVSESSFSNYMHMLMQIRSKRELAVEATFEIISNFIQLSRVPDLVNHMVQTAILVDDEVLIDDGLRHATSSEVGALLNQPMSDSILPSLDSLFVPRDFHRQVCDDLYFSTYYHEM
jgi:hypothetical protein